MPATLDPAPRDGQPVLHARFRGLLEWLCPRCTAMNRSHVDPSVARVRCCQPGCRFVVGVGLALVEPGHNQLPPFNARVAVPRQGDGVAYFNYPDLPDGLRAVARIAGPISWQCRCGQWTQDYAAWLSGDVLCAHCHATSRFAALLIDLSGNTRRRTPSDWVGWKGTMVPRDRLLKRRGLRLRQAPGVRGLQSDLHLRSQQLRRHVSALAAGDTPA